MFKRKKNLVAEQKEKFKEEYKKVERLKNYEKNRGVDLSDEILSALSELEVRKNELNENKDLQVEPKDWVKLEIVESKLNNTAFMDIEKLEKLDKIVRLKDFAIENGYDVSVDDIINPLNDLMYNKDLDNKQWKTLDDIVIKLTDVTFPITADTLSTTKVSKEYRRFKKYLIIFGASGLIGAIIGYGNSDSTTMSAIYNSLLASSLGLLGAVVYSLFNVLKVVPPQAFNPNDEYANYARLVLGILLGWVFFFAFATDAYSHLSTLVHKDINKSAAVEQKKDDEKKDEEKSTAPDNKGKVANPGKHQTPKMDGITAIVLLIPFIAGYSTKFVVGVLDRGIYALEAALGIEEKRERAAQRARVRRGGT
jgi:hypothetical protein